MAHTKRTQKPATRYKQKLRQREALDYRLMGYTHRQIAQAMNISASTAHSYVQKALQDIIREPAEDVLKMELERYDNLLVSVFDKATDGDLYAFDRVLQVMARIERLHGIEAPKQQDAAA